MKNLLIRWSYVFVFVMTVVISGCTDRHDFSTDPNHLLTFSRDTVSFDTLFTDVSSATQVFLIYNRNKKNLSIDRTAIAGGDGSPFRVNIDGLSGREFSDLTIRGGDSMYVFVEVTIDPRGQNKPFEVLDHLQFMLESGTAQQVVFSASGQDATVLRGAIIDTDVRLTADRPYLIYDSLRVELGSTLSMAPGTRLYFADRVEMQVYGRVEAIGTADSLVVFRGARTDNMFDYLPYDRLSAQWGGITLHESSTNNVFEHCDIHSGTYGLRAKSTNMDENKVVMHSSQIHNVDEDALQVTSCKASFINSLFTNAGGHCVNVLGGQMDFIHCTIANFYPWKGERGVAVNISNYVEEELHPLLGVNFVNSFITGTKERELQCSVKTDAETEDKAQYSFKYSVINSWKEAHEAEMSHFENIVWENKENSAYGSTNFRKIDRENFIYDFHLDSLSVARRVASEQYLDLVPYDKDGNPRQSGAIDAGCYQSAFGY